MSGPDEPSGGSESPPNAWWSRRTLLHGIGLLLAVVTAWLIVQAYRRPDFVIDLSNFSLC